MKKALCLVALLGLVASASAADGRVFVTGSLEPYGLTKPANALRPTFSTVDVNNVDYDAYDFYNGHYVVSAFPPSTYDSSGVKEIRCDQGEFAYIWIQFDASVPKSSKINGLQIGIVRDGTVHPTPVSAFYLCNDMQGDSARKRWNGTATPPNYPELSGNNVQSLLAITAYGVQKVSAAQPDQLYNGIAAGAIALLGAVNLTPWCGDGKIYTLQVELSNFENYPGASGIFGSAQFKAVPEPASLLLLTLAGWAVRRR
jgi:hypothetical protein